jgi:PPOX class probable F420-dependent enzyme
MVGAGMVELPKSVSDLVSDDTRALAALATIMPDGTPQVTPVWFEVRDGFILVNTSRGRVKDLNMSRNPAVALSIVDPKDPYRYMQVRGVVVDQTELGGQEHLDHLSKKYLGLDHYPRSTEGQTRVTYTIKPTAVFTNR